MKATIVALLILVASSLQAAAQEPTSQPLSKHSPFTFAVVSDLHVAENDGPGYFKAFVKQIDALPEKPEFVLVPGDIHVDPFKKVFEEIKPDIPYHVVAGNHENRDDRDTLAKMFPNDFKDGDFYSFTHKNSVFIAICDAAATGDHIGHFESEFIKGNHQGQWLEEQLARNSRTADHVFIFGHIPPNPEGNVSGGSFLASNDQRQLRELTLKYKPSALFFGHLHDKKDFAIGDSPVYVLPSLNWNVGQQPRGFMTVRVFKNAIEAKLIPLQYP